MKIKIIAFLSGFLLFVAACTKSSEDRLAANGGNTCDTTSVKYSAGIQNILQVNCYRCHGNGNTGGSGGILLEGYANLLPWAKNGYLVGNVTHAPGYIGMPYGEAKLPDCEVNTIVAWVNQGAQNN
jgi:mono/diheme cytochrome c family protein